MSIFIYMLSTQHYGLQRSLDTYLKTEGKRYTPPDKALQKKISLGESKSGPCKACKINQKTGAKMPPLHKNCRCSEK